jgi:2-polyprenyl-3-methyl-5-hydroxy-6-metoxy-1,4-benzoquinol methylase
MESLIKKGLFNDKSGVNAINGAYNNIDIKNVFQLEIAELTPEYFDILDNDGEFNKSQSDFFKDSGALVDSLGRSSGVFNSLPQMMTTFRQGILEEIKVVDAEGEGRNAVWLAELGFNVTAVDASEVGLSKGLTLAKSKGVKVDWIHVDLQHYNPGKQVGDVSENGK